MNFDLKEKLGPLPVWAWGVMVGLLLVAGIFVFRQKSPSSGASNVVSTGGTVMDPQGYQTAGIAGGTGKVDNSGGSTSSPTPSNTSWLSDGSRAVAAKRGVSVSTVYAAMQKYLQGAALSNDERQWVDQAINLQGSPPDGTYGISPVGPSTTIKSKGFWGVDPGGGGQSGIFELYDDGSNRWISGEEWGVIKGRGQDISGTLTVPEFNSQYGTGRSDDPA